MTTTGGVVEVAEFVNPGCDRERSSCFACSVAWCSVVRSDRSQNHLGVVKPHGRLGPLRLEWIAPRPRAAYRRGGLPRPFRRVLPSGMFILGRASHLDAFS